jgi:type II secretory pathway pseudopilin PulG
MNVLFFNRLVYNYCMKKHLGFTVLEFLVVIAIIIILISIALAGLNTSREKAIDEKKATDIKTIVLGLEQYHQVCNEYPSSLDENESCSDNTLSGGNSLKDYIPELAKLSATPDLLYVPLTFDPTGTSCDGFHIGVLLKNTVGTIKAGDSDFNSQTLPNNVYACSSLRPGQAAPFDGTMPGMFDIIHY